MLGWPRGTGMADMLGWPHGTGEAEVLGWRHGTEMEEVLDWPHGTGMLGPRRLVSEESGAVFPLLAGFG